MAQLPQIDSLRRPNAAASAASKPRRFPWLHLPLAIVITLLVGYGLSLIHISEPTRLASVSRMPSSA